MMDIAVTGGIACGKSLVAGFFRDLGARVCSADIIAREVLAPGGEAFGAVVERFGEWIIADDGTIDRRLLGRYVFDHPAARADLEALVHGPVKRRIHEWREAGSDDAISVVEVPLLFEAGMADDGWDAIVCVVAPESIQESRLEGLGFSIDEARARLRAQMPVEQKAEKADYVVMNGASKGLAREQVESIWRKLLRQTR
jgi:dephospho-CoA kinase